MKRRSRGLPGSINTVAAAVMRALSIGAPAALLGASVASAQVVERAALTAGIPAQPLAQALEAFASQTGVQFVYLAGVVHLQRSRSVPAGLNAPDALARMLAGTGLKFEYLTPRSIRILAATSPRQAAATNSPVGGAIEEVVVTANRREEKLQHVPMTVQVLSGATLAKLNATTFDDFVLYLPAVTSHGVGPAQNDIYVRGLATAAGNVQSAGVIGSFPNVAVYLDEQSAQLPNRNLDIYTADLERIEILEGPQGTLFGAGAEAGVVRYITNKPKLDLFDAKINAGYAMTAHGAESNNLDATINFPLIDHKLAARLVLYNEQRGGYIDNTRSTFARAPTDPGMINYFGGQVPPNSVAIDNFGIAANDINSVTYQGSRAELLYRFNDAWDVLITQSDQKLDADGVFTEMAANSLGERQPDLSVQLYNPSYDRDRFSNTALTVNGRIGALTLLYAGSYLKRDVQQVQDYTNYSRAQFVAYYQCVWLGPTIDNVKCFTPSSTWRDAERNTHSSHELRLSTPVDGRVRAIGGLFYENYRIQEQVDWFYLTALPYFYPIGPPTGYYTLNGSTVLPDGRPVRFNSRDGSGNSAVFVPAPVTSNNPDLRPSDDGFFEDVTRGYTQKAAYASIDLELVPRRLTLTAGTRYASTNTTETGSVVSSGGCSVTNPYAPNPCINHSFFLVNIDAEHLDKTYSGFNSRANLSWQASDDALLYYTWSQGFRAGGFNRAPIAPPYNSPLAPHGKFNQVQADQHGGWVASVDFAPDRLVNNEVGWKTQWLSRRLQWNGALYQEDWRHTQMTLGALGIVNLTLIANGGDYRVRGLETSGVAHVAGGFTIEASAAWNHSELVRRSTLLWRDGTPIDFSELVDSFGRHLPNAGGALGTPLAGAPPFQGNIRLRYEFTGNGYQAFAQIGAVHQSHSLSTTYNLSLDFQNNSTTYDLPAFTTFDAALGVGKNEWRVQLYGENLSDTRAEPYAVYLYYKAINVNRPRTIGLRCSYAFTAE